MESPLKVFLSTGVRLSYRSCMLRSRTCHKTGGETQLFQYELPDEKKKSPLAASSQQYSSWKVDSTSVLKQCDLSFGLRVGCAFYDREFS